MKIKFFRSKKYFSSLGRASSVALCKIRAKVYWEAKASPTQARHSNSLPNLGSIKDGGYLYV